VAGRWPAINAAATEVLTYFTALAAKRRADPRDDLLSDLLAVTDSDSGRLTGAELLHNLTLLLVAGFETTTNLLGNGLHIVLHDRPAGAALRDGSVPPSAFVEEVLRFDSPVQLTSRIGYDTKVGGMPLSDGIGVTTLLGAGNRDPAGSPTRTGSTRCARTAAPSASVAARISASAPRWPGSRAGWHSPGC
jgi:cytochrome P450